MRQTIEQSLQRITHFLAEQSVTLEPLPTFVYTGGCSSLSRGVIAQVPGSLLAIRTVNEELSKKRSLRHLPAWYRGKGVTLSQQALSEYVDAANQRLRKFMALSDEAIEALNSPGAEMLFYTSLEDVLAANPPDKAVTILDDTIAHEIWHVVEQRHGLLNSPIVEGTAEYARHTWRKWKKEKVSYDCPDLSDTDSGRETMMQLMGELVYNKGLEIVRGRNFTLPELLVPQNRRSLETEYNAFMDDWVGQRAENNDMPYEQRAAISRALWPEFDALDAGLTSENFLLALRAAGLNCMATELERQDCSGLLGEYLQMGYGPKN